MLATYYVFKTVHLIGIVLLIGNVTVSAFWKTVADRTGDAQLIAFSQRLITYTDWFFTLTGIVLTIVGGFGASWAMQLDPLRTGWIVRGELLFLLSGLIWLGLLVPIQVAQARVARGFGASIPIRYWRLGRWWLVWGIVATVPLVAAVYVMIVK